MADAAEEKLQPNSSESAINDDADGQTSPEHGQVDGREATGATADTPPEQETISTPSSRLAARKKVGGASRGGKSGRNLKPQRHIREKRRSTGVIQLEEKPENETETKTDREAKKNADLNESLGQVYPEVHEGEDVLNESLKKTENNESSANTSNKKEDKDLFFNKINSQEEEDIVTTQVLTTTVTTNQRSRQRENTRRQQKNVPNGKDSANKDSTNSGLPVKGHTFFKLENYKSEFSYSVSSPINLDKIKALPITTAENSPSGNRLTKTHTNSETICESCKMVVDREKCEKQRVQKKLTEAEELVTKLRREISILNEDLISAEEEVDKLKEENSALVSVVGRLSTN